MRNYDKDGWKKKIDPAFDKTIKNYLLFIKHIEKIPNDGQIEFEGNLKDIVNQNLDFLKSGKLDFNEIVKMSLQNGLADDSACKVIFQLINPTGDWNRLFENIDKLIERIPEDESKKYYHKKFREFITDESIKPPFNLSKKHVDFLSVILSLLIKYFLTDIDKVFEKETTKEDIDKLKNPVILMTCIRLIHVIFYDIAYQKSLIQIVKEINNGNDESLFKAIRIDKGLLSTKPVMERIQNAQITGDKEFLNRVGKEITNNPLKKVGQHGKTFSVITFFWLSGLYRLKNYELHCLLETCGVIPPPYPDGFDKFMQRYIKPLFKNIPHK